MSVQFGIWNFDAKPVDGRSLEEVDPLLGSYAPDQVGRYCKQGVALVHHALHTMAESRSNHQPYMSPSGRVYLWDGRLDNRDELTCSLNLSCSASDVEVFAAAFDKWNTDCFARMLGDWAVTVWSQKDQSVVLARDLMGIRPLYYEAQHDLVRWCSVLEPLITLARRPFNLNYEYVAGWSVMYPAANSTPYAGVFAVPPCSFVSIHPAGLSIIRYWDFDPSKRILYRSDLEYEEHYRTVFRRAVQRCLRSDHPVCCELSGGNDSTSITSVADIIASTSPGTPNILTLSYFDDSEPHSNERPFVEIMERKRGHEGFHIDVTGVPKFNYDLSAPFQATPTITGTRQCVAKVQGGFFKEQNIRVVLSGIGGDEVMGGVPTPQPELQDLIAEGQFKQLAHQLKLWAITQRRPWFFLLWEAIASFLPELTLSSNNRQPARWLTPGFIAHNRRVNSDHGKPLSLFGALPSFQNNLAALEILRRQLGTKVLPKEPAHERRYPFLDRDLLEFLFAIPREQLLRPGYRRSLMRRALRGIVPPEVLDRKRKAYTNRGARVAVAKEWDRVVPIIHNMATSRIGMIDEEAFRKAMEAVRTSDDVPLLPLLRTLLVEVWLRNVLRHGVILDSDHSNTSETIAGIASSISDVA